MNGPSYALNIPIMKNFAIPFIAFYVLVSSFSAQALPEERFDFYTRGPYRENVPRPQSILRFDVGDHHTTYAQMENVMYAIQRAAPDRVKIYEIGLTKEHRMQYVMAISSPENIARIDEIRANTARLTDPRSLSSAEANAIAQNTPATAWMAYAIHGNESASFEAMMQVMYQLAASEEPATLEILRNTLTLIVASENPDGHERFVTWYNSVATGNADRNAIEHREPWSIFGRFNHYRFDLNRDTLAMTQLETKNMAKAYLEWNPQVAVDHHGQTSQFFFPPVALPINPNLPQPETNKWQEIFGRANARAFDANRWEYYVRDIFDAFYPGYWDMYPALNGAIAMTYETDGGGFKGLRWTRDDGTIATLRSAIAKHYVASMTTLETTAANRQQRVRELYDFRARSMNEHVRAPLKRIMISSEHDRVKAAELIEVLRRSKIEVNVAQSPFTSQSARTYMEKDARPATRTFPAGTYIIDLNQPQRTLIKTILEPDTPQDKAFVDDNMARFRRNQMRGKGQPKEQYGFYDITAWSLPLAFGLEAHWTSDTGSPPGTPVTDEYIARMKRGQFGGRAQIAYIIPYETDSTMPMVIRLLQEGFRVNIATRRLNAAGRNWPEGTVVVRVTRNLDTIHEAVNRLAGELGVNVYPANSGFPDEGDTGIGGEAVLPLSEPKIAMVADEAVDITSYGSIWWTFDRYGIKFTPLSIAAIRGGALRNYNVLVMPNGSPGRYFGSFGEGGVSTLKSFASGGGTIVTVSGASVFATLKDVGLTTSKMVGSEDDEEKGKDAETKDVEPAMNPADWRTDKDDGIAPELPPIASPSADANKVPVALPGSIMRATVDRTTFLNYGLNRNELPVLLASGYFFRYSKEGTNALIFDAKGNRPLTISGFVWEGNTERLLRGTAYVIDESHGGGRVTLFAEEPFYRGIFRSASRPFFNSIAFGGQ
ncbi:MAG TPA: M14 family zinc carboxypeptidase [Pyrinomonadaceae bacterium]|nr:M14 family zinc carboxypeptidase [Pyrinomonadaceae bacterium]HMP64832.1 M14 family zinc carboxypeptidase [Pyrinomonadaceae bacterium]